MWKMIAIIVFGVEIEDNAINWCEMWNIRNTEKSKDIKSGWLILELDSIDRRSFVIVFTSIKSTFYLFSSFVCVLLICWFIFYYHSHPLLSLSFLSFIVHITFTLSKLSLSEFFSGLWFYFFFVISSHLRDFKKRRN